MNQVEQHIREKLVTVKRAEVLSNALFSPEGLFGQLAHTEAERRELVRTPLFRQAQARLSELERNAADLLTAVKHDDVAGVKEALARGTDVDVTDYIGQTPLMWAVWQSNLFVVRTLIAAGADVNARDVSGNTSFILASIRGEPCIVDALLPVADYRARDREGMTALQHAEQHSNTEVARLLREHIAQSSPDAAIVR